MARPFTKLILMPTESKSKFIYKVAVATDLGNVKLWVNHTAVIRRENKPDEMQRRPEFLVNKIADEAKSRVAEELARRVPQLQAERKVEVHHAIIGTGTHDGEGKTIDKTFRWTVHLLDKLGDLVDVIHVAVNAAEQYLSDLTTPAPRKTPSPPGSPRGGGSLKQNEAYSTEEYSPKSKGKQRRSSSPHWKK